MTETDTCRPGPGQDDSSLFPASQFTPADSVSANADANTAENVMGRGLNLSKLQTDIPDDEQILRTGSAHESDSNTSDQRSEYDSDRRGRGHPYMRERPVSKSYTAEEERRVVKKFDRRLVLFMALLYMLAFLDRSSKLLQIRYGALWILTNCYRASRHWKCQNRGVDGRSKTYIFPVRMGPYCFLYHIHCV